MNKDEMRECLARKRAILEKIGANTATQDKFVRRREMRGLRRLLRERAVLIDALGAVCYLLDEERAWLNSGLFTTELRLLGALQTDILSECDRVLHLAMTERTRIAAEINNSRLMRKAKSNYVHKWTLAAFSNRLNVKG